MKAGLGRKLMWGHNVGGPVTRAIHNRRAAVIWLEAAHLGLGTTAACGPFGLKCSKVLFWVEAGKEVAVDLDRAFDKILGRGPEDRAAFR